VVLLTPTGGGYEGDERLDALACGGDDSSIGSEDEVVSLTPTASGYKGDERLDTLARGGDDFSIGSEDSEGVRAEEEAKGNAYEDGGEKNSPPRC